MYPFAKYHKSQVIPKNDLEKLTTNYFLKYLHTYITKENGCSRFEYFKCFIQYNKLK